MKKIFKYILMIGIGVGVLFVVKAVPVYAADAIVVTTDTPNGWFFAQETPTGSGGFVVGPSTTSPPGGGSAQLTVNGTGGELFGTFAFAGTRLDTITSLGYSTYRTFGSGALSPALEFDVDTNITDSSTAFQGRLVYEPYYTHTVSTGVWQTWNPLDNFGTGNWWFTGAPGNTKCPIGNACTWAEVLADFPNIGIRFAGPNTGAFLFKAGGGWASGFVGSVDAFSISVNNVTTTYDFGAPAVVAPSVLLPDTGGASNANRTTITVVAQVNNDNGGTASYLDFPLFINGVAVASGATYNYPPGVYTITETNRPGYTINFTGDCDANGKVSLAIPGGSINPNAVCTVVINDIGSPTEAQIPPLIDVVKIPNPLALPEGPGQVTYTYTVTNIGVAPMTDISLIGDTCSSIDFVSGDTNNDAKLDVGEKWIYTCTSQLNETTKNTVVAIGHANGLTANHITNATVVVGAGILPPLIHVIKVPSPLALPAGGGPVTFTITVTNPGAVALSNVGVTEDILNSSIRYVSGDTNGDSKLDPSETWVYTYQVDLNKTVVNTVVASGLANGLVATDFALATVVVAEAPGFPNTGLVRDLKFGMRGEDVKALQQYLNNHGYILAKSGAGSLGQETNYFGRLTQSALIKFQKDHNISPAVGYFGPITRGVISRLSP